MCVMKRVGVSRDEQGDEGERIFSLFFFFSFFLFRFISLQWALNLIAGFNGR